MLRRAAVLLGLSLLVHLIAPAEAGRKAVALLPMRALHAAGSAPGTPGQLVYGIVACAGRGAGARLGALEREARANPETVRHDGQKLVDAAGRPLRGGAGCRIVGERFLLAPVFFRLMDESAGSPEEHAAAQLLWLAVRGKAEQEPVFERAFTTFVREGIGAVDQTPRDRLAVIARYDARYSPCDAARGPTGFEKRAAYTCLDGRYVQVGTSAELARRFDALAARIAKTTADLGARIAGHDLSGLKAWRLQPAAALPQDDAWQKEVDGSFKDAFSGAWLSFDPATDVWSDHTSP